MSCTRWGFCDLCFFQFCQCCFCLMIVFFEVAAGFWIQDIRDNLLGDLCYITHIWQGGLDFWCMRQFCGFHHNGHISGGCYSKFWCGRKFGNLSIVVLVYLYEVLRFWLWCSIKFGAQICFYCEALVLGLQKIVVILFLRLYAGRLWRFSLGILLFRVLLLCNRVKW